VNELFGQRTQELQSWRSVLHALFLTVLISTAIAAYLVLVDPYDSLTRSPTKQQGRCDPPARCVCASACEQLTIRS